MTVYERLELLEQVVRTLGLIQFALCLITILSLLLTLILWRKVKQLYG